MTTRAHFWRCTRGHAVSERQVKLTEPGSKAVNGTAYCKVCLANRVVTKYRRGG